jgi:hypothetical protein
MVNLKFRGLQVKNPKIKKCVCGKCGNLILIVEFEKTDISFGEGLEWVPSLDDLAVITETLKNVYEHNKKHDTYCYESNAQKVFKDSEPKK